MIVAQEVVVAPKCQRDVPVRTLYGHLSSTAPAWMTEAKELQPGVHLARVVVGGNADTAEVRVININEAPVKLDKDKLLGGLHPVEIEYHETSDRHQKSVDGNSHVATLLAALSDEVTPDIKAKAEELLNKFSDILSVEDRLRSNECYYAKD